MDNAPVTGRLAIRLGQDTVECSEKRGIDPLVKTRGFQAYRKEVVLWTIAVQTNEVVPPDVTAGGLSPIWVFGGAATCSYRSPCALDVAQTGQRRVAGSGFQLEARPPFF